MRQRGPRHADREHTRSRCDRPATRHDRRGRVHPSL